MKKQPNDTKLTSENRRKIRCASLATVLRRFFVYFLIVIYIIDNQDNMKRNEFFTTKSVVKNRAKHFQDSQSCSLNKSKSQLIFDYFTAQL